MTLMTISEAARFLRLSKRTLYQRTDIPRIRYGHRIMFVKEDLEAWIGVLRDGCVTREIAETGRQQSTVDPISPKVYHRNPLFISPSQK
ncbi:putative Excisionase [Nitrospira japonica]|uniref:Putative Excisionase n=1 Tax=Nitrospira japonica TaxID=1325564 RepID=A0A1W1IA46_9BACT|nr:putative Excisionase [Nitrospira japonica]